jgi:hypothetical protein
MRVLMLVLWMVAPIHVWIVVVRRRILVPELVQARVCLGTYSHNIQEVPIAVAVASDDQDEGNDAGADEPLDVDDAAGAAYCSCGD